MRNNTAVDIEQQARHDPAEVEANAPACLRALPHWVCWRYELRDGKRTKPPYSPHTGNLADHTNPRDWATFTKAAQVCKDGQFSGIGFVLQPPYAGVDLDDCVGADGAIKTWAAEIIDELNSYSEISPSGAGVKIFIKGRKPGPLCKTALGDGKIEIYDHDRYFTVTGNSLDQVSGGVEERQEQLHALYHRLFHHRERNGNGDTVCWKPNPLAPVNDDDAIRILLGKKDGGRFRALWDGHWQKGDRRYQSQSHADMALVGDLVWMMGNDPARIDRLFRRSGLYREKWDRPDYRRRTINEALRSSTQFYTPSDHNPNDDDNRRDEKPATAFEPITASRLVTSHPQPREPVIDGLLRRGETANIMMPPKTGKSKIDPDCGGDNPVERARAGKPYMRTDLGNAERFAAMFGDQVRHVHGLGWLIWDNKRWQEDDTGAVVRMAATCVRNIYREAAAANNAAAAASDDDEKARHGRNGKELNGWALACEARAKLDAMIALAKSMEGVAVRPADLDADPWLLNVANGTLDLQAGKLRGHLQADLITKMAPVEFDEAAQAPKWMGFIYRIFRGSGDMVRFAQRACGSTLSGAIREHVLHLLYGDGANGKSTFLETWASILGDYAAAAPPRLLVRRNGESHPTELADLRGRRFVSCIETAEGGAFDESRVKALTGGDTIKARLMRENFFSFRPSHKLFLATNHKPVVNGDDNGIWRRIRLWPFTVEIPDREQDHDLKDKLIAEAPGILAWAVRGCLDWQREGLGVPEGVRDATEEYRAAQDVFGGWLNDCCEFGPGHSERFRDLYESYKHHCDTTGSKPLGNLRFSEKLRKRQGVGQEKARGRTNFTGVRLTREELSAGQNRQQRQQRQQHFG